MKGYEMKVTYAITYALQRAANAGSFIVGWAIVIAISAMWGLAAAGFVGYP